MFGVCFCAVDCLGFPASDQNNPAVIAAYLGAELDEVDLVDAVGAVEGSGSKPSAPTMVGGGA